MDKLAKTHIDFETAMKWKRCDIEWIKEDFALIVLSINIIMMIALMISLFLEMGAVINYFIVFLITPYNPIFWLFKRHYIVKRMGFKNYSKVRQVYRVCARQNSRKPRRLKLKEEIVSIREKMNLFTEYQTNLINNRSIK